MHEVEIKLPSNPKFLKIVRCSISQLCELCGLTDGDKNAVVLAVDEAASNIIKHAYRHRTDQPILIHCRVHDDRLEIVLRDFGQKAEPERIKPRDLKDVKPGGLGVHFIRSSMDEVHYSQEDEKGNRLTLVKYIPGKKERK